MAVEFSKIVEFRGVLDYINSLTQQQLVNLWNALTAAGVAGAFAELLLEGVAQIIRENRGLAVDAATVFYEDTQGVPVVDKHVEAAREVNMDKVRGSVQWALSADGEAALDRLAGFAQRQVYDGARDYATAAIEASYDGGWYRMAMPDACEFCKLLATRALYEWGPYGSAESAIRVGVGAHTHVKDKSRVGDLYHDHCRCIPIKATEFKPNEDVEEWGRMYQAARKAAQRDGVNISSTEDNSRPILKYWREVDAGKWDVEWDEYGLVKRIKRNPDA